MQSACISDLQVIMQPPAGIDLALPQIIGLPDSCSVNMPKNNIWMWAVVLICLQWMICGLITELLPAEDAAWRLSVSRTIITMNKPDKGEPLSLYRLGRIKPPFYLQITSFIYWKKHLRANLNSIRGSKTTPNQIRDRSLAACHLGKYLWRWVEITASM